MAGKNDLQPSKILADLLGELAGSDAEKDARGTLPTEYAVFKGYLAKGVRPGHLRIYPDLETLHYWLEVAEDAIVHTESSQSSEDYPGDPSIVWVRSDATMHENAVRNAADTQASVEGRWEPLTLNKETLRALDAPIQEGLLDVARRPPSRASCSYRGRSRCHA